jgi:hypothetical protein
MERSLNSEAGMGTNSKKANILRAQDALREMIPGKCQLFDMLPKFLLTELDIFLRHVVT